jgi:hypothetical protein
MCVNVISYFDTWLVAPYFVRGSSVLIGWAAGFLTDTARVLPIVSDPHLKYFAAYGVRVNKNLIITQIIKKKWPIFL